jgi:peptide/nickel transport system ATP-binding protein
MSEPLLRVEELEVHYPIRRGAVMPRTVGHVRAVDGVSLEIGKGETYGLVGESGSGKSTLGRAILHLTAPTAGSVRFEGQSLVAAGSGAAGRALRRRIQMVFQDPMASLDPRQRIGAALAEPLRVHRLAQRGEVDARVHAALDGVGLAADAAERFPHEFSGGQRQRIGIARALILEPELIVADEPVSALDVSIQAQVLNLLRDLQRQMGLAYLFISHDLAVVRYMSRRIGVMYLGRLVEEAPAAQLCDEPLHPYTRALLEALPERARPGPAAAPAPGVAGEIPSPSAPPSGCRFRTRCPLAAAECAVSDPPLREVAPGRRVACHFVGFAEDARTA